MKFLLDENLSDRIVAQILDLYPGSSHVKQHALLHTDDSLIWTYALQNGYILVSKDADFHQRSLVFGHPPKLVYLRIGNCSTTDVVQMLRSNYILVTVFSSDSGSSILILP